MFGSAPAWGDTVRVATLNAGLVRDGPGLLLRDILKGEDAQIGQTVAMIAAADADVLLLTAVDFDYGLQALAAFSALLRGAGADYPYLFARPPNNGVPTGLDLDHDGRLGGADDAQGHGRFFGQAGMAILSKYPIDEAGARDFSAFLWKDLPGATLPVWPTGRDEAAAAVQRLSSAGHWDVPVRVAPGRVLRLLAWNATPPVFDGPEDRNGLRNRDENLFWLRYLDGALPWPPPDASFVLLGDANLDPADGDGDRSAIARLLADPRLQDPRPRAAEVLPQTGVNATQSGDPALDTARWSDAGPGNLRVDYVLPSADLELRGAGVIWPDPAAFSLTRKNGAALSWHGLVWVDIAWQ